MHMAERQWARAHSDFFEAFRAYDEAGSAKGRVACLKYLVLAAMLMGSQVDPFESQEAKPYKQDPEVAAMTDLVAAYQANDLARFERVLQGNAAAVRGDSFVRAHVDELRRRVRQGVVLAAARPYARVRLGFLARKLGVEVEEVEQLLVGLILDGRIQGRIDQVSAVGRREAIFFLAVALRIFFFWTRACRRGRRVELARVAARALRGRPLAPGSS
jgi:COP9 signalosome complex subunit 2